MTKRTDSGEYFPYSIQISRGGWACLDERGVADDHGGTTAEPFIVIARRIAGALDQSGKGGEKRVSGGEVNLFALLNRVYRHVIGRYATEQNNGVMDRCAGSAGFAADSPAFAGLAALFVDHYPHRSLGTAGGKEAARSRPSPVRPDVATLLTELLILSLAMENPALVPFVPLFDDRELAEVSPSRRLIAAAESRLRREVPVHPFGLSLPEVLRAPLKASPRSLAGQVEYIRKEWQALLSPELYADILVAVDIVREEERVFGGGPGKPRVMEFLKGGKLGRGEEYPEYERFSVDADWMANVVMIAKMTYVWLDQLSKKYGRHIHRLDQVPDEELDLLARQGFTALWLIGVWERSPSSQKIKQIGGNPDAISSAYSLYDYVIAHDLGGEEALNNLKERCNRRGIRLASDMVPNHTGIYSRWTVEHPDWFIQLDYPPYPAYDFTGPDLSFSPEVTIQIEDGYWDRRDAAVVFRHYDHRNGRTRYIYHGNDGTSTPWNDTAQLNYLVPEVREAVIRTIIHVARQFPIIRFDAAMTLAKKHYQRLWYPQPGHGSGVPSRAEHGMERAEFDAVFPEEFWREVVDRVAVEAPGTLLLAEAFWLMEGYFVRTLGMHRVYNSAFMNMLKMEENAKYRQTIKNVLEFDPQILKRFVNFMNNPDERTAVEQFGKEGKYFGACMLLVTMPGLPMIGHGQIEGFHEKYGMEYRRAYWDEPVDEHLLAAHERLIFPLMRRRHLFSGSEQFVLYDFFADGRVDENVFAYSNRAGDERGLVLFNNRFGDTAGWIRTSTAMARSNGRGDSVLVQTTMGETLGCNPDGRFYYAFRDYCSGLEYLRSGRDLTEQGLFVTLSAYQYRAFLDFREICDDEFGTWGRLCHLLQGQPVASLDEEVKLVRYERELDLFRSLLDTHPPVFVGSADLAADGTAGRLVAFCRALAGHCGREEVAEPLAQAVAKELTALAALATLVVNEPRSGELPSLERAFAMLSASDVSRTLTLAWLYLRRLSLLGDGSEGRTALDLTNRFALMRVVAEELFATSEMSEGAAVDFDVDEGTLLVEILLCRERFFITDADPAVLFTDAAVARFLRVHESDGVVWFSKERFEYLLEWLLALAVVVCWFETADPAGVEDAAVGVQQQLAALRTAAGKAGYRVASFLATETEGAGQPQSSC
jgi:glycosidase